VLGGLDLELVTAGSGTEALGLCLSQEFAAILLDVRMPGKDGFATAELIRQCEDERRTPIIFIDGPIQKTGGDDTDVRRGYALGAADYVFRPLSPEGLRAKVSVFADLFENFDRLRRRADEPAPWQAFGSRLLMPGVREAPERESAGQAEGLLVAQLECLLEDRERELESTRAFLEAVLEGTASGVLTVDEAGVICSANGGAARLLGCRCDELLGCYLGDALAERSRRELEEKMLELAAPE
jgi:CheY-like chemotaxis protein